ncbi:hypothetical protein CERSUDRAFT_100359 [Gelatoporia subvermispora B]|uniref:Uncharacterized protein n=1 Tax=Ceriporiopsis subvermispora (strain B) TaxID=914234 RepID=M2P838_CERS8|nr:hypothetical protein CERSUDRAFT_100359 [Gelatoporia subvermispora B]
MSAGPAVQDKPPITSKVAVGVSRRFPSPSHDCVKVITNALVGTDFQLRHASWLCVIVARARAANPPLSSPIALVVGGVKQDDAPMNGNRPPSRLASSGVEEPVAPSHAQPQANKRKGADDSNPLATASKKLKKEASLKSAGPNKRKFNGEEQPGGLVIVRAPSARPASVQPTSQPNGHSLRPDLPQPRATSRPPSVAPSNRPPDLSKPPSKKFKAADVSTSGRTVGKGKDRNVYTSTRADPEVDEDVRQMQSETDTLRRKSQAAENAVGNLNSDIQFPPPKLPLHRQPHLPPSNHRVHDASHPLPLQETPQIERNKMMREGGHHRRRSSLSRGKRISSSYEATGVIAQPHTSVSDTSFYKHIDCELPEPQRARQLLIWCSHRAMNATSDPSSQASTSKRSSKKSGKDPPPLSETGSQLLKRVQDRVIRMLAEKQIDTNVYSPEDASSRPPTHLKQNEQNVKNRAREARFNAHIQRMKAEEDAWLEISNTFNAYRSSILTECERLEKRHQNFVSARAKGKQRATVDDLDAWEVEERYLPEHFRGRGQIELARSVIQATPDDESPLRARLRDLEFKLDHLHGLANSALESTRVSQADLDRRFALLNISLVSRSQSAPPSTSALSSYLPPTLSRPHPTTDPQDLLRALSRIDASRPQAQVGDAARRAVREVQRAADASGGLAERKLTGVPPPTPRKPPGTPRRATTPGRGR